MGKKKNKKHSNVHKKQSDNQVSASYIEEIEEKKLSNSENLVNADAILEKKIAVRHCFK